MEAALANVHMKRELVVILEIAKLFEKPLDAPRTIQGILRLLAQLYGLNCGRVVIPNEDTNKLEVRYSYGLSRVRLMKGRYSVGFNEGVTGYVMRTGSIGLVPDITQEPLYIKRITEMAHYKGGRISFIAVPILEEGTPIGVLSVQREGINDRPFDQDISLLRVAAAMVGQALRIHKFVMDQTAHLVKENQALRNDIAMEAMIKKSLSHGILGSSPALMDAVRSAIQVAKSDAPVMLLGESGTGKEKFARMIHQHSDRREKPFICINCAAIPADLLESELFGHEKGSFTGATSSQKGKILLANRGTLFLDEIGDMPFELQSKLLRVLQEKQVDPIGSSRPVEVDFRIITATHVNLQEQVNRGHFRLDLFYRLHVVPVELPPLRERRGDIKQLALHFLNELNHSYSRNMSLSTEALKLLERFDWPGNIRQLQNVLEHSVLMSQQEMIDGHHIEAVIRKESRVTLPQRHEPVLSMAGAHSPSPVSLPPDNARQYQWVKEADSKTILAMLDQTGGNKTEAARRLNMTVRQLRYRIDKLGIKV